MAGLPGAAGSSQALLNGADDPMFDESWPDENSIWRGGQKIEAGAAASSSKAGPALQNVVGNTAAASSSKAADAAGAGLAGGFEQDVGSTSMAVNWSPHAVNVVLDHIKATNLEQ